MINVTRGACENSGGVRIEGGESPRGTRRVRRCRRLETEGGAMLLLSICMPPVTRPAFIVLSSWRYQGWGTEGKEGRLISAHIFLSPNKRSAKPSLLLVLLYFPLEDTLEELAVGARISVPLYFLCTLASMISNKINSRRDDFVEIRRRCKILIYRKLIWREREKRTF